MLSIDGLITGIDTTSVIEGLLSIQQGRIKQFEERQAVIVRRQTAFSGVEARLLALRSSLGRLSNFANSALRGKQAVTSDEAIAIATASDQATTGIYSLTVNQLAAAHQVISQGFASLDDEITQGTVQIAVGNSPAVDITIDGTNNTLQGLIDGINNSGAGVRASVITDTAGGVPSYRVLLNSQQTGTQHAIQLTNNLAADSGAAVRPDWDLLNPVQAAADAQISLGSGPGAIQVSSSDNQIDDLVPGVTLSLESADATKPITLKVSEDVEAAKSVIEEFVTAYNDFIKFANEQSAFNSETGEASPLLGERSLVSIQSEIQFSITSAIAGVNSKANRLSAVGITVQSNGQLSINSGKLEDALAGRIEGVDSDDVIRLFALSGKSDRSGVRFVVGGRRTQEGSVQVEVTSVAERATITGESDMAASIVIDDTNNTLQLRVDGRESNPLTLAAGTYTQQELAAHVQDRINADQKLVGSRVTVTAASNRLTVHSTLYGATSEIQVVGGTSLASLGLTAGQYDNGQDVVGNFIVDGVVEAAKGNGQLLIGNSDNHHTADLQVRVTLTAAQLNTTGPEATLNIARGIASRLDVSLGQLLDPVSGRVKFTQDRFDQQLEDLQEAIDRMNERFETAQESLIKQFAALESSVSEIQNVASFLSAQLATTSGLRAS